MRHPLLAMVVALVSLASQARDVPPEGIDPTPAQIDRMADAFERAVSEGQAWASVKGHLDVLYRAVRAKGETRSQAIHNLGRIGLPGVDIGELGQRGQQVRRELEGIAQDARRRQGLTESAAVAATALALREVLLTLVAVETPSRIHLAVAEPAGHARLRRSEQLNTPAPRGITTEFTEQIQPGNDQACTVETLRLAENVHFSVTCRARGKGTYPMAVVNSECSIHNDRLRAVRMALQSSEAEQPHEVFVWCSYDPS